MALRPNVAFGGALVAIWGAEMISGAYGWLSGPYDAPTLPVGAARDYLETLRFWMAVRFLMSIVGVSAGILIVNRRRSGYWLSVSSAAALLLVTDFKWFTFLVPGVIHSSPFTLFFVKAPALGYGVIVLPILIAIILIVSAVVLLRTRKPNVSISTSAI